MDSFEKLFHKLYPKTVSNKIKLKAIIQNHIETLEKKRILDGSFGFDDDPEIEKWQTVLDMIEQGVPQDEIDEFVFSDIFPPIF